MASLDSSYCWDGGFIIEKGTDGVVRIDTVSDMMMVIQQMEHDERLKNLEYAFNNHQSEVLLGHLNIMATMFGSDGFKTEPDDFVSLFADSGSGYDFINAAIDRYIMDDE
jgi:hypothetical protein